MNEQQYTELCRLCDRVLMAQDSTIERMAIPWLHVIREHPEFLANYEELFDSQPVTTQVIRLLMRVLHRSLWSARQLARSVRGQANWFVSGTLPERVDVLFVSHLLNSAGAGASRDFYFGQVPDEIVAAGQSAVIAVMNHSNAAARDVASIWSRSAVPRVVFADAVTLFDELAIRQRLRGESSRLKSMAKLERPGLFSKILFRASQEARSPGALTSLRLSYQIGALMAKLKPRAIVVTHEGHAFERVAFAAARRAVPFIRCIGYQHSAVFRLQHAIRRNLASEYIPDRILTAGEVGRKQLAGAPALHGIPISVLGSNRGVSTIGTSENHLPVPQAADRLERRGCLVLPEGISSECLLLFDFSLACAIECPEIEFIWRLHPLLTAASLLARHPSLRQLPANVRWSNGTLDDDIQSCRWAIYRGTTAIIRAAGAGLRPIYLQRAGEMTIDPLYELTEWRIVVTESRTFKRIIQNDTRVDHGESMLPVESVKDYLTTFFTPFSSQRLLDLLPKAPE